MPETLRSSTASTLTHDYIKSVDRLQNPNHLSNYSHSDKEYTAASTATTASNTNTKRTSYSKESSTMDPVTSIAATISSTHLTNENGTVSGLSSSSPTPVPAPAKPSYESQGVQFWLPDRFSQCKGLGKGSFGCVISAFDSDLNKRVAIKKITGVWNDELAIKRVLREWGILKYLNHPNVMGFHCILTPPAAEGRDDVLYLVSELFESDINLVIKSGTQLDHDHIQYLMYQIFLGLAYLHSFHIIHRDIKPGNLLVDRHCRLKLCDFGLSRLDQSSISGLTPGTLAMTEHVVSRWYRAPEIFLCSGKYTVQLDVWAAGCVMAELLGRQPIFPGKNAMDQLQLIIDMVGRPTVDDLSQFPDSKAKEFVMQLFPRHRRLVGDWASLFPFANKEGLDLLSRVLHFNPKKRLTALEALQHPYFASLFTSRDLPAFIRQDFVQARAIAYQKRKEKERLAAEKRNSKDNANGLGNAATNGTSTSSSPPTSLKVIHTGVCAGWTPIELPTPNCRCGTCSWCQVCLPLWSEMTYEKEIKRGDTAALRVLLEARIEKGAEKGDKPITTTSAHDGKVHHQHSKSNDAIPEVVKAEQPLNPSVSTTTTTTTAVTTATKDVDSTSSKRRSNTTSTLLEPTTAIRNDPIAVSSSSSSSSSGTVQSDSSKAMDTGDIHGDHVTNTIPTPQTPSTSAALPPSTPSSTATVLSPSSTASGGLNSQRDRPRSILRRAVAAPSIVVPNDAASTSTANNFSAASNPASGIVQLTPGPPGSNGHVYNPNGPYTSVPANVNNPFNAGGNPQTIPLSPYLASPAILSPSATNSNRSSMLPSLFNNLPLLSPGSQRFSVAPPLSATAPSYTIHSGSPGSSTLLMSPTAASGASNTMNTNNGNNIPLHESPSPHPIGIHGSPMRRAAASLLNGAESTAATTGNNNSSSSGHSHNNLSNTPVALTRKFSAHGTPITVISSQNSMYHHGSLNHNRRNSGATNTDGLSLADSNSGVNGHEITTLSGMNVNGSTSSNAGRVLMKPSKLVSLGSNNSSGSSQVYMSDIEHNNMPLATAPYNPSVMNGNSNYVYNAIPMSAGNAPRTGSAIWGDIPSKSNRNSMEASK